MLGHAVRHDLLAANPADALTSREKPKPGPSRKRFLTDDEIATLLDATTGRYHTLVALLLFSGLRISEALGLVWRDVDLASGHCACATSSTTPVITLRTYAHLFRAAQQEARARDELEDAYGKLLRQR